MNTILRTSNTAAQNELKDRVDRVHGSMGTLIPRDEFLPQVWETIVSFINSHRDNTLVAAMLAKYPDLAIRGYTLVSVRQGLFTYEPVKSQILKGLIDLLGEDINRQKSLIYEQAVKSPATRGYFPELVKTLEIVESVYGMDSADPSMLPGTPYLGYKLFTLEYPELVGKETCWAVRNGLSALNEKSFVPIMGIEFAC